MILQERQECLNPIYHEIEGINRRRAFVSTKYMLAHEQFDRTLSDADYFAKSDPPISVII